MTEAPNARLARVRRRKEAAIVREDLAITRFAAGLRVPEISAELRAEFGGIYDDSTTRALIRRGLARRKANAPEGTEEARTLYIEGYRQILAAHMPYATGALGDGPSVRSADVAMRALDKIAEVSDVRRIPESSGPQVGININVGTPEGIHDARDQILATLRREAEKHMIVEGALAGVGTSQAALTSGEPDDDTLGPPPGVIPIATQEEAA